MNKPDEGSAVASEAFGRGNGHGININAVYFYLRILFNESVLSYSECKIIVAVLGNIDIAEYCRAARKIKSRNEFAGGRELFVFEENRVSAQLGTCGRRKDAVVFSGIRKHYSGNFGRFGGDRLVMAKIVLKVLNAPLGEGFGIGTLVVKRTGEILTGKCSVGIIYTEL